MPRLAEPSRAETRLVLTGHYRQLTLVPLATGRGHPSRTRHRTGTNDLNLPHSHRHGLFAAAQLHQAM